ncbi:MAG TPA: asparagine synthase-related protein [Longimicrobiales bacterium]
MNGYLCALRLTGEPLRRSEIFGPVARVVGGRSEGLLSAELGAFAAVARTDGGSAQPLVARWGQWAAAGDVRLHNRAEVAAMARQPEGDVSDLLLVLAALDARGPDCVQALHGDFAFVAWDARGQKLVAARDPFGVRPLFMVRRGDILLFSSRLSAFEEEGGYDLDYVADFLVSGGSNGERTIWAGARALRAGSMLVQRGTVGSTQRFWSAESFGPDFAAGDDAELAARFRELFREGIRANSGGGEAWAQLSGGLDSSSVVATVQSMAAAGELEGGLGGTVSIVDSLGDGDERPFSDEIVTRYGVRNDCLHDYWAWRDDGAGAPMTDEPRPIYPFFERDRRMANLVQSAGGRVLLSGLGSDHLLYGNLGYISDLAARGHVGAALGEAARWAVARRQSFWTTAQQTIVLPFLPRAMQLRLARPWERVPAWIPGEFARGHALPERVPGVHGVGMRPGRKFQCEVAAEVSRLPIWVDREPFNDSLEMRYPFLYRPLVEFCLQLPVRARIRPEGRKWVLREAMRDVLPERIRLRAGKGGMDARILWSLERERGRLERMLRRPILADLGCVEPAWLRNAVEAARQGIVTNLVSLMYALSLETWLSVRAGRWSEVTEPARTAA